MGLSRMLQTGSTKLKEGQLGDDEENSIKTPGHLD